MRTRTRLIVITAGLLICVTSCSQNPPAADVGPTVNQSDRSGSGAITFLEDFYKAYISGVANEAGPEGEKKLNAIRETYCSPALLKKISEQEPDADMFLNAQDANEECLSTLMVRKNDAEKNLYTVTYEDSWSREIVRIDLVVEPVGNSYRITDIR